MIGASCGILVAVGALGSQPAGAADRYQVRRGDTLSAIAARVGVPLRRLASANHLADPNLVVAGTWLVVPDGSSGPSGPASGGSDDNGGSGGGTGSGTGNGRTHVVAVGETLSAIAARYGLSTAALAQANGIADPDRVFAGTRLQVPSLAGPVGYVGSGGSGSGSSGGTGGTGGTGGSGGSVGTGSGSGGGSSLPSRLQQHPERLALMPTFDQWASAYGVPPDLLKAMTYLESGWQQNVVSSTGAVGIGQLMPATVITVNRLLGTSLRASVATENIRMSARYLGLLLATTGGDSRAALAGYYQGLASVHHNGLYPSTIAYVNGVEALRIRFR